MNDFKVEVTSDHRRYYLSITQNGYQWHSFSFTDIDQLRYTANTIHSFLIDSTVNKKKKEE